MADDIGSLVRHAARAACLVIFVSSFSAGQAIYAPPPDPTPPTAPAFMSRYAFHLSAAQLFADDIAFRWDTHFGGDWDLLDYVRGRLTFLADYQAVLGNEKRLFDPNQGNYVLEGAGSYRFRGNEIYAVLHHESRHLGDRPKIEAIAWNELDARYLRQFRPHQATLDVRVEAGKVTEAAFVDYSWTANGDLVYRRPISPHVAAFARLFGTLVGIDASKSDRATQKGGKIEGGIRLNGEGGGFELFGGYEQVIDADAFAMVPRRWAYWGFRMVTK
jgi:hypothetical protein